MADHLVGRRGKAGQLWVGHLNLLEAFLGKCRGLVKAGSRGGGIARIKKGDKRRGTIRERRRRNGFLGSSSSLLRGSIILLRSSTGLLRSSIDRLLRSSSGSLSELFVTIINIWCRVN